VVGFISLTSILISLFSFTTFAPVAVALVPANRHLGLPFTPVVPTDFALEEATTGGCRAPDIEYLPFICQLVRKTMPIYEYECKACGHRLEEIQSFSDQPLTKCPQCKKGKLIKLVSAPSFRLKGTGWYATDFKNSGKPPVESSSDSAANTPAASDAKPAAAKAEAKKDTKKDSKKIVKAE
jgi:putative FmdB family regulatory protein